MSLLAILVIIQFIAIIWFRLRCVKYRAQLEKAQAMLEDGEMARIVIDEDPVLLMRLRLDQDR